VVRIPDLHLSLNPYLAYTWEEIDIDEMQQDYNSVLYGLTLNWRWKMIQTTLKYYLEDNLDLDEQFHTVRGRFIISLTQRLAIVVRAEYMEHSITKDTAVLVGPAFVF